MYKEGVFVSIEQKLITTNIINIRHAKKFEKIRNYFV